MSKLVLLIEDDEDLRQSVRELLETNGYRVSCAANGVEALDALEELPEQPCLVLLDLMMPVMDGWSFLERVKEEEKWAGIPVVVSTSVPDRAPFGRPVLAKPMNVNDILSTARTLCGCRNGDPGDAS